MPQLANGFFALELYLKSLIKVEQNQLRKLKHSISKMYHLLNPFQQKIIKNRVEAILIDKDENRFEKCLKEIDNSFEFWRYIYEKDDLGFGLNYSLKVLQEFLGSVRYLVTN